MSSGAARWLKFGCLSSQALYFFCLVLPGGQKQAGLLTGSEIPQALEPHLLWPTLDWLANAQPRDLSQSASAHFGNSGFSLRSTTTFSC